MMKWLGRISVVLCVAVAGMWVASYFWTPVVHWSRRPQVAYFVSVHHGYVEVAKQSFTPEFTETNAIPLIDKYGMVAVQFSRYESAEPKYDPHSASFRSPYWFGYSHQVLITLRIKGSNPQVSQGGFKLFVAPLWYPMLLFAIGPMVAFVRAHRRRARILDGICVKCGYDLRATPDRCPECGVVPEVAGDLIAP